MADVELTYKGNTIGSLSASGSLTLETAGKYCEADIGLTYTSPGGGGGDVAILSKTLSTYSNNDVVTLGVYAFYGQTSMTSVSLPNCTKCNGFGFQQCTSLTSVYLPEVQSVGNQEFGSCSSLVTIALPKIGSPSYQMFVNCTRLETVDLAVTSPNTGLQGVCFQNCSALDTLILRCGSVAKLGNVNSFQGTPFASGGSGGTIYVPSSLISSYQTATNWSTLYGYGTVTFAAIEGSQYENYYADGTPIS